MEPATNEIKRIIDTVHYRPAVTIILPFEPKMGLKSEINHALKLAVDKIEKQLKSQYPDDLSTLVLHKLNTIIKNLNFNTHKKSIAIFVSPVFEKVLYLDIPVDEKIIIDESFEIRDLVFSKKELHKYLVLVLSGKESRIYLGNTTTFVRIVSNTPESVYAYVNDKAERVSNFSDPSARKDIVLEKFLRHIDNSLGLILQSYPLPLFVAGTDRTLGHFKKLSKHGKSIVDCIKGNFEDASAEELKRIVEPYVSDWKKVKQKDILNILEEAEDKKRLAKGINAVWQQAMSHKGRLLVVEKNFMYPAEHGHKDNLIYKAVEPYNKFSYIKDAVDDVIEKVLESGGDVEFVDEGVLNEQDRIALIQHY